MSRSDRIKEELSWLKLVFAASVAVDVSLIGWLAENHREAARLLVVSAYVGVVFSSLGVGWIKSSRDAALQIAGGRI